MQQQRSGGLNSKVQSSVGGAVKLVKLFFMDLIPSFFIMVFAVSFALYQSTFIGTVLLFILPINAWLIVTQLKSQRGVRVGLVRAQEEINGMMIEMISGVEETRVAHFEGEQLAKVSKSANAISEKQYNHHKGMVKFDFTKGMLKWSFHILILSISLYMAYNGSISVGDVLTYSLLFMASIKPIEEIHRYLDDLQENSIKANDLKEILEDYPTDPSFAVSTNPTVLSVSDEAEAICISGLRFQYRSSEKKGNLPLLKDVSLHISKGNYVGIVGTSGCGKSSLIKNILRLQTGEGSIEVFGNDLQQLSREEIARQVVYIPQNPFIFNGTIRENITFGCKRSDISDQEIHEAIKKACLSDYINSLEHGLDTMITERGTNLSGGQRQRMSVARVFINDDKPIIILDEATSAMDNTTEAKVYDSLRETGRTIISIAHRLNTLVSADKIVVLEDGRIVQEDSYYNLISQPGLFSKLAEVPAEKLNMA
jgi:ABC-type multidrug transport system fused ATPase/permease subunit